MTFSITLNKTLYPMHKYGTGLDAELCMLCYPCTCGYRPAHALIPCNCMQESKECALLTIGGINEGVVNRMGTIHTAKLFCFFVGS